MADEPTKLPMYTSYLTFANMLDWLQEMGTVPSKFDRSLWGKKFGGSTGGQLVAGMKFLGLLDGDNTTAELDQLALAPPDQRKALIAELLREAYGGELVDALPRMTPKMLSDAFEGLGATDATRRKAISFFINAAKAADLPMHQGLAKQARNRPSVTRKPGQPRTVRKNDQATSSTEAGDTGRAGAPSKPPPWVERIDPTIRSWLERIPSGTDPWPPYERERWHNVLTAIFDGIWGEEEPEGQ